MLLLTGGDAIDALADTLQGVVCAVAGQGGDRAARRREGGTQGPEVVEDSRVETAIGEEQRTLLEGPTGALGADKDKLEGFEGAAQTGLGEGLLERLDGVLRKADGGAPEPLSCQVSTSNGDFDNGLVDSISAVSAPPT